MTITTLDYCGTGLSFDGTAAHVIGLVAAARPDAAMWNAAADQTARKTQGIRPRRPEPA